MNRTSRGNHRTVATISGADPDVQIFSPTKYRIMQLIRMEEQSDLESLSKKLSISQMAVYKHVKELESKGLLEHEARRNGVGRPRLVFRASSAANGAFPKGYSKLAASALEFVQEKLGKEGLDAVFSKFQGETVGNIEQLVGTGNIYSKTRRLAGAKKANGYMAQVRRTKTGEVDLIEHNCPVASLVSKYPDVCEAERLMLERALGAKVTAVKIAPNGTESCRFRISPP